MLQSSKMIVFSLFFCLEVVYLTESAEICYPTVGCFSNDFPYNNVAALPESPVLRKTQFLLFTPENPSTANELDYTDAESVRLSTFNTTRPTKVVIHGLGNSLAHSPWIIDLKSAILSSGAVNVIVLEWSEWCPGVTSYDTSVANVYLVATQLKIMLSLMRDNFGLNLSDVHLIGFSLGAHLSGYAGALFRQDLGKATIGRITGLDPANHHFEGTAETRLDPTDAIFVDVIHTNGRKLSVHGGFGTAIPSGHTDFYPNGGSQQPGCVDGITGALQSVHNSNADSHIAGATEAASCSHGRAHEIFLESIKDSTKFVAFPCKDYDDFLAGSCLNTNGLDYSIAGYHAERYGPKGDCYLKTQKSSPYSGHHIRVAIKAGFHGVQVHNVLQVALHRQDGTTSEWKTVVGRHQFSHHDMTMIYVYSTKESISPIQGVYIRFTAGLFTFLRIDFVDVFHAEMQKRYRSHLSEPKRLRNNVLRAPLWISLNEINASSLPFDQPFNMPSHATIHSSSHAGHPLNFFQSVMG